MTIHRDNSSVHLFIYLFIYFLDKVESRGKVRTLNGSGANKTKGTVERGGGTATAELKDKIERDLDKRWVWGEGRTRGMDKIDAEANPQERKTGNLEKVVGGGVNRVRKDQGFGWEII